tara:strand:- start:434 stop:919 length:486 start_codon:yes stop_codon:yes gene_type:complete
MINALTKFTQPRPDAALLLIRGITGIVFSFHGAQKLFGAFGGPGLEGFAGYLASLGFPFPTVNAYLAGGTEFFGGLALLLGLGTRFVSLPLAFTMLVASFTVHAGSFSNQVGGMEYSLTLAVVSVALALSGGGRHSLERLIPKASTPKASAKSSSPSLAAL